MILTQKMNNIIFLSIGGSQCGRDRPGFGCPAVYSKLRGIQYYRVLNIINLKLYIVLKCLECFIILNYNFYNIIKFKKDITEKVCLVVLHGLAAADAMYPLQHYVTNVL